MRLAIGSLLSVLAVVVGPGAAVAETPLSRLALAAVDQPGSFFDLTMKPGERRTLEVAISNDGGASLGARTYAADVYTIVNGGFGGRLRDEPQTGTTSWLDYAPETLRLAAGERGRRSFTVDVPADAAPGEYITSLILEHDQPFQAGAAIDLNQVVRQAVAVVITVPGRRSPALEIGEASHLVLAGKSIVSVALENSGNVRLKPLIEFTLSDAADVPVSHASVAMDTFYAKTATFVEVPLTARLRPGKYTVRLMLEDPAEGLQSIEASIPLLVEEPPPPPPVSGVAPGLTDVIQGLGEESPLVVWGVLISGLLALGLVIVGVAAAVRRRRLAT